jgi:hypothetical protein
MEAETLQKCIFNMRIDMLEKSQKPCTHKAMHEADNVLTVSNLSFADLPEKSFPVSCLESKLTNWAWQFPKQLNQPGIDKEPRIGLPGDEEVTSSQKWGVGGVDMFAIQNAVFATRIENT